MSSRTAPSLLAAVALASLMAGCGDDRMGASSGAPAADAHVLELSDGSRALVNEPTNGFMDAQIIGEVAVAEPSSCWGVRDDSGDTWVVVWPSGAALNEDRDTLAISPGVELRLGDTFDSSGGYVTPDTVTSFDVTQECGDVERIVLPKEIEVTS